MRSLTVFSFAVLAASSVHAQVQLPDTPAARQYAAWRKAQDSGDRAVVQQFIEKSMPWGRADQEVAMGKQSGGYDVKKVETSTDTNLVVLAQERGPAKQFVRITFNVSPDGNQVAGIRIGPAQPPPDLAPPKMTAADQDAARKGAPFRQFSAWLDVFNSGDRAKMDEFLKANFPSASIDGQMNFRERTGGLELPHRPGAGAGLGSIRAVPDCRRSRGAAQNHALSDQRHSASRRIRPHQNERAGSGRGTARAG